MAQPPDFNPFQTYVFNTVMMMLLDMAALFCAQKFAEFRERERGDDKPWPDQVACPVCCQLHPNTQHDLLRHVETHLPPALMRYQCPIDGCSYRGSPQKSNVVNHYRNCHSHHKLTCEVVIKKGRSEAGHPVYYACGYAAKDKPKLSTHRTRCHRNLRRGGRWSAQAPPKGTPREQVLLVPCNERDQYDWDAAAHPPSYPLPPVDDPEIEPSDAQEKYLAEHQHEFPDIDWDKWTRKRMRQLLEADGKVSGPVVGKLPARAQALLPVGEAAAEFVGDGHYFLPPPAAPAPPPVPPRALPAWHAYPSPPDSSLPTPPLYMYSPPSPLPTPPSPSMPPLPLPLTAISARLLPSFQEAFGALPEPEPLPPSPYAIAAPIASSSRWTLDLPAPRAPVHSPPVPMYSWPPPPPPASPPRSGIRTPRLCPAVWEQDELDSEEEEQWRRAARSRRYSPYPSKPSRGGSSQYRGD